MQKGCHRHQIRASYLLLLSIAVQRHWYKMITSIIVDVINIHFLSPMIDNFLLIIVEKYQASTWGPHIFATIKKFWFFALNAKDLSKNIIWMILSQRSSKSIAANTLYTQRGIVWYFYYDNRQVGCIFYFCAKVCAPCDPWGTKSPKGPWYQDKALWSAYGHDWLPNGLQLLILYLRCYLSSHLQSDDINLFSGDTYL